MSRCELVRPTHLERQAIVYVRQSSPHQVNRHHESQALQYALRQRAVELGWRESDVRVIDCDLGHSAASVQGRRGFQQLVADVALGKVGILLAYDATRLARNCSDWYSLLDTCGHRDCLLGDAQGVYDPGSMDGRLLLGLKGQISELELHTLRSRLNAGLFNKARRGELALCLPVGLVRGGGGGGGEVLLHPNREVQDRLRLVFDLFLRRRSAAQVVRALREHKLSLPRRDRFGDVIWRVPTQAGVCSILKNPAYAGAFVYGRTRCTTAAAAAAAAGRGGGGGGRLRKPLPEGQWRVCLQGKYPSYISWECYHRIGAMLADNYAQYRKNQTRGTPRRGSALLQGIAFCGECGHKMVCQYKRGTRYVCNHLRQQFQEPLCQVLPADPIERCVLELFMSVFCAAELDVHERVLEQLRHERKQAAAAAHQQLQRLRYQAQLAERQFNQSDPDNRLVTAELEKRWEAALAALRQAEQASGRDNGADPPASGALTLDPALRQTLEDLGQRLPQWWPRLSCPQKKQLLRCLIDKVVLHRSHAQSDQVQLRVVWRGGQFSSAQVPVPVRTLQQLSQFKQLQQEVLRLGAAGHGDAQAARRLTRAGFRSPSNCTSVLPSTVREIRLRHGVLLHAGHSRPRPVAAGHLTVTQMAKKLGILSHWIYDRIHNGVIQAGKDGKSRTYLIPDNRKTLAQFRALLSGKLKTLRI
jgi:DNA invertase Pin-like site-specific DNA recombinase